MVVPLKDCVSVKVFRSIDKLKIFTNLIGKNNIYNVNFTPQTKSDFANWAVYYLDDGSVIDENL